MFAVINCHLPRVLTNSVVSLYLCYMLLCFFFSPSTPWRFMSSNPDFKLGNRCESKKKKLIKIIILKTRSWKVLATCFFHTGQRRRLCTDRNTLIRTVPRNYRNTLQNPSSLLEVRVVTWLV